MLGSRNREGLNPRQVASCHSAWERLCGEEVRELDVLEAHQLGSRTRFVQARNAVLLGADAYPGIGASANSRMSYSACLARELAHWERYELEFDRPFEMPDGGLDEAETSIHASFMESLSERDRKDLVEDARDRLIDWLAAKERQ